MAAPKTIVLITGANGGIGFELAAQLIRDATKHVLLGSRSIEKGQAAVQTLQKRDEPGTVELLEVDVTSEESIAKAAGYVEKTHGRLDALVNNAAVAMPTGTVSQQMALAFATNATGPHLMVESFSPLLQKSTSTPRVINVSSGVGIISKRLDKSSPLYNMSAAQYRASKCALNMVTANQIVDLGKWGCKVFGYDPGFTVSGLSANNITENGAKPTSEGAAPMVKIINGERDDEEGQFLIGQGSYPWS